MGTNGLSAEEALAAARKYTAETVIGGGAIKGKDGFSPIVSTEPIEGGTEVTITDAEGDHTFDVMNGTGIVTNNDTYKTEVSGYVNGMLDEKSFNANNRLYIALYVDDARSDLSDIWDIVSDYDIPINVSVPSNTLDNIANNGQTIKALLHDMEDAGCEIHSHSVDYNVLSAQSTRADAIRMLKDSKQALEREGFTVHGFVNPGGTGAIPWSGSGFEDLIFKYYDYCDCSVYPVGLSENRTSLSDMSIDNIGSQLNSALRSSPFRKFFFHGLNDTTEEFIRAFITKAQEKGLTFVTEHQLYENYTYSIISDRLLKLESLLGKYTGLDYDMFVKGYGRPSIENPATYQYMIRNNAGGVPRLVTVDAPVITVKDSSNNYHLKKSDSSSFHVKVYSRNNGVWSRTTNETSSDYNMITNTIIATNFDLLDDNGNTVCAVSYHFPY
jgi:peptidoglycan/xylan/chitin deacetylase (PgdA/CDA1 family)